MTDREIILELQQALKTALTGGNHIASNLIGLLGGGFHALYQSPSEASTDLSKHEKVEIEWVAIYEQWCCWNALMRARGQARKALIEYDGETLSVFRD